MVDPDPIVIVIDGAVEFLTKPFRHQDLLDAIQQAIGRDRAGRDLEAKLAGLRARYELLYAA